jgi:hypothetical protein
MRRRIFLALGLVLLAAAILLFMARGGATIARAAYVSPKAEPTESGVVTPAAGPTPSASPAPETGGDERVVLVDWPSALNAEDEAFVTLTLDAQGNLVTTVTPASAGPGAGGTHPYTRSLIIDDVYDDYVIEATATFNSLSIEGVLEGGATHPLERSRPTTWRWRVQPLKAGQRAFTLGLDLRFTPKAGAPPRPDQRDFWHDTFVIDVRSTLFNLTATQAGVASLAMSGLGLLSTLFGIWDKVGPRLRLLRKTK